MGRPVAVECVHGDCTNVQVADDVRAPAGVYFDICGLFEGKALRNAQTEMWACCTEHRDAALKLIRKDLCRDEFKALDESED
ncbi:hypothetical protein WJX73_010197 [Symbiochloris irregularis]|uniref:Uncharacterized protein n=1 Tax=Symbiochloris irregularis TaxID=706552 RepID=A0AAW1PM79_9CHLO